MNEKLDEETAGTNSPDIILETKLIGDIKGRFVVPDYQRGYRWGKEEVKLLLDDIFANADKPYCLQPIVVRNNGDRYELIDGQQRLTTIYLIYAYLHNITGGWMREAKFSLEYETRAKSSEFLKSPNEAESNDNIDFFFMWQAYRFITEYFKGFDDRLQSAVSNINKYFDETVSVIWYEVPDGESGIELFERLNIGKIPLTSSELVKALFLRGNSANSPGNRQEEIALQWDNIERELNDRSLWAFLTNSRGEDYSTRIDLILDLMADKPASTREKYYTFFYFENIINNGGPEALSRTWENIYLTFLTLREWYNEHDLYHKIGYLITSESKSLRNIYDMWNPEGKPRNKADFQSAVDNAIRESVCIEDLSSLSYNTDAEIISKILLLMNVETERLMDDGQRRFPFDKHKDKGSDWSLEHIHAQHSEGLNTNEKRRIWLEDHAKALIGLNRAEAEALAGKMLTLARELADNPRRKDVESDFRPMQEAAVRLLTADDATPDGDEDYLHRIDNLALIDRSVNSALSNYVFDAKRDIIIRYDKSGKYIPVCTKMVFFKYYSGANSQLHYWSRDDRRNYLKALTDRLKTYLPVESINNNPAQMPV